MFWERAYNIISISECFSEWETTYHQHHLTITSQHFPFRSYFFGYILFLHLYSLSLFSLLSCRYKDPSYALSFHPKLRGTTEEQLQPPAVAARAHPFFHSSKPSGRKAREDEEAQGHVPRLDPPFITSVRIGRRGLRELPVNLEREHLKGQISISFHALRWGTEPERARERENERLVLKIDWGYPREMQPQTRCDRYSRLKRECQYPWMRTTTHTKTDK